MLIDRFNTRPSTAVKLRSNQADKASSIASNGKHNQAPELASALRQDLAGDWNARQSAVNENENGNGYQLAVSAATRGENDIYRHGIPYTDNSVSSRVVPAISLQLAKLADAHGRQTDIAPAREPKQQGENGCYGLAGLGGHPQACGE